MRALIGALSAISGYWLAALLDASIAGAMVTMAGVVFGLVYLLAPDRGLIAQLWHRSRQRWEFAQTMLAIHLLNHDGQAEAESESQLKHCRIICGGRKTSQIKRYTEQWISNGSTALREGLC